MDKLSRMLDKRFGYKSEFGMASARLAYQMFHLATEFPWWCITRKQRFNYVLKYWKVKDGDW